MGVYITIDGLHVIATMISMHAAPSSLYINRIAVGTGYAAGSVSDTALGAQITNAGYAIKTAAVSLLSYHRGFITATFTSDSEDMSVGEAGLFALDGSLVARCTDLRSYFIYATRNFVVKFTLQFAR
jgi:hypothetical protein